MLRTELYEFQQEAVDRMVQRGNLLLALVMGAGKTVTTIAAVEQLVEMGAAVNALIICPSSIKYQWRSSIMQFTGKYALVIDGPPAKRMRLYDVATNFQYVITNFEAVVNDFKVVKALPFDVIAVDEATAIKGFDAKRSRAVKSLGKHAPFRFALTGQPIENRPEDLYSIMQFVDPDVLGPFPEFDATFIVRDYYGKPTKYRNLQLLNKLMTEPMVRKTREDIADQLPRVIPTTVPLRPSRQEAALYNAVADMLCQKLDAAVASFGSKFDLFAHYNGGDRSMMMRAQGEIMSALMVLRMVCIDARLALDSANLYERTQGADGAEFAFQLRENGILDEGSLPESTKMRYLAEQLPEYLADDVSKVVMFSSFKGTLRCIPDALDRLLSPYCQYELYTGDMNAKQKDAAKRRFKEDPNVRLLLSSDAGGYGVDIPEANYLISVDLPWSTGKYEQRESRIIRLSSTWDHVNIMSLIYERSIERRIHDMLGQKKGIADAFLDGKFDGKGRFELTLSSLGAFLRENTL